MGGHGCAVSGYLQGRTLFCFVMYDYCVIYIYLRSLTGFTNFSTFCLSACFWVSLFHPSIPPTPVMLPPPPPPPTLSHYHCPAPPPPFPAPPASARIAGLWPVSSPPPGLKLSVGDRRQCRKGSFLPLDVTPPGSVLCPLCCWPFARAGLTCSVAVGTGTCGLRLPALLQC